MLSSFFYSQDIDCPICSPNLHPTCTNLSFLASSESLSTMTPHEHRLPETATSKQTTPRPLANKPILDSMERSDNSIASSSSSLRTGSTLSSIDSSSSSSSSRNPVKRVLANISARYASPEPRSSSSRSYKASTRSSPRMAPDPTQPTATGRVSSGLADTHPYNFFEASLHIGANFTTLEDGWLHPRRAAR
jgi:hypothetical protein